MTAIRAWLEGLGLGEHAEAFEAEKIDLESLPDVTAADLKEIGLPIGPRRKVLRAVSELTAEGEPPLPAPAREAERWPITVMFCDLVGPTALAERLDREDHVCVRAHERTGRPLGGEAFVASLERRLGRALHKAKPGPKPQASSIK